MNAVSSEISVACRGARGAYINASRNLSVAWGNPAPVFISNFNSSGCGLTVMFALAIGLLQLATAQVRGT